MFRQFSILCSLGAFLVLVILLACDNGPTGSNPSSGSTRPSSSSYAPPPSATEDGTVEINNLDFRRSGIDDEYLQIAGDVITTNLDSILSKVEIQLDGKKILDETLGGENDNSYTINHRYKFDGEECCKNSCQLFVSAYMNNGKQPKEQKIETVKRDEDKCIILSSSSEASSSSSLPVSTLSLSPVLFNGSEILTLKTGSGNKGFNLSTGEPTENKDDASFYFAGQCMFGTNGDARLVYQFDRESYPAVSGSGDILNDLLPNENVNSASQFKFIPADWESDPDYKEYAYYVACPSAKTEWDESCYLIYADGVCQVTVPEIKIKVWEAR